MNVSNKRSWPYNHPATLSSSRSLSTKYEDNNNADADELHHDNHDRHEHHDRHDHHDHDSHETFESDNQQYLSQKIVRSEVGFETRNNIVGIYGKWQYAR